MEERFIKIGLISISDRASSGQYIDKGLPNLKDWLKKTLIKPFNLEQPVYSFKDYEKDKYIYFYKKESLNSLKFNQT